MIGEKGAVVNKLGTTIRRIKIECISFKPAGENFIHPTEYRKEGMESWIYKRGRNKY